MQTMIGRVLLADDSQLVRTLVSKYLKRAGPEVVEAENGKEAITEIIKAKASGRPFDMILMDCQMPVMSGFESVKQLRGSGFSSPIVALTASNTPEDKARCLQAGYTDFLPKPVGAIEFFVLLRKYLKVADAPEIKAA